MSRRSKRNIRTLPANRMEYLLENYPADVVSRQGSGSSPDDPVYYESHWSREQVLKAMQAAFEAGKRDAKKRNEE